jgi:Aldo/keto reductase family
VDKERTWRILDVLRPIAQAHETSIAAVALAWILAKPFVTSVIIGAKRVGQKRLYPWYSNWKILQFTCQHCGWTGKGEKTFPNEAERRAAWKRIQSAAKRYGVELEESD